LLKSATCDRALAIIIRPNSKVDFTRRNGDPAERWPLDGRTIVARKFGCAALNMSAPTAAEAGARTLSKNAYSQVFRG
jgi:hypothetical protein